VFLDRDGVINRKMPEGEYVSCWSGFHLLPGVPRAIARLNQAGLRVIVVTNQRGVALGRYSAADVEEIHAQLARLLEADGARIDAFFFCPHDKNQCDCRKPLTGLFHQAVARFPGIEARSSIMIGDSVSDIEFGRRLGMSTIFIEGDPERRKPGSEKGPNLADQAFRSLPDAVDALLDSLSRPR
jgi:D-glycero-D-manno-heptose 1,7-bisphosphate phosphatase